MNNGYVTIPFYLKGKKKGQPTLFIYMLSSYREKPKNPYFPFHSVGVSLGIFVTLKGLYTQV